METTRNHFLALIFIFGCFLCEAVSSLGGFPCNDLLSNSCTYEGVTKHGLTLDAEYVFVPDIPVDIDTFRGIGLCDFLDVLCCESLAGADSSSIRNFIRAYNSINSLSLGNSWKIEVIGQRVRQNIDLAVYRSDGAGRNPLVKYMIFGTESGVHGNLGTVGNSKKDVGPQLALGSFLPSLHQVTCGKPQTKTKYNKESVGNLETSSENGPVFGSLIVAIISLWLASNIFGRFRVAAIILAIQATFGLIFGFDLYTLLWAIRR